jgi:hypothetical protein
MTKEVLNARISPKTEEQLEDWADDMGITKSEATNRLLDKALEIEDNDDVIVQTDGGVIEERFDRLEKQIPDGEAIERFEEIEEQTQSIASDQQFTTKIHGWMALSLVGSALCFLFLPLQSGQPQQERSYCLGSLSTGQKSTSRGKNDRRRGTSAGEYRGFSD